MTRARLPLPTSAVRLLAVLCVSIFVGEMLVMLMLSQGGTARPWRLLILDSSLLLLALFPILYFVVFRPLRLHMSEMLATEDERSRLAVELRAALDSSTDGVMAVDSESRLLHANRVFATVWKIPDDMMRRMDREEILQLVLSQLEDPEAFRTTLQALYAADAVNDGVLQCTDGRVIEWRYVPMSSAGTRLGRVWSFRDVTERARVEARLRATEERWKFALEALGAGVWDWDLETGDAVFSARYKNMLGFEDSELPNRAEAWSARVHPDDMPGVMATVQAHLDGATPTAAVEYRLQAKDGSWKWIRGHGVLASRTADGRPKRLVGTNVDITISRILESATRDAEVRVRRQRGALAHLVSNDVMAEGGLEAAARLLAEQGATALEVERASVWLLSDDRTVLKCVALHRLSTGEYSQGAELRASDFPRYFAAIAAESRLAADDARADARTSEFTDAYLIPLGITSTLDAGVLLDGVLAGVVCLEHVGPPRHWHADEEAFAGSVAAIMGQAIQSAARQQAERALRESALQLEMAQRFAKAGSWDWSVTTGAISWTPKMFELFGLDPSTATASFESWRTALHPDDMAIAEQRIEEALRTHTTLNSDYRVVFPDGSIRWITSVGQGIYDDNGQATRMVGLCLDISERKQAELSLLQSKEFADNLIDTANVVFVELNLRGEVVRINPDAERITGYSLNEVAGKNWFELLVPRARYPEVWAEFERITARGEVPRTFENPIVTKAGDERFIVWQNSLLREQGVVAGTISFGVDITERMRAEAEVRASEAALKEAQRLAHLGHWMWNADEDHIWWSEELYDIYGVDPGAPASTYANDQDNYTPESAARLTAAVKQTMQTEVPYEIDLQLSATRKAGVWVTARGEVIRNSSGKVVGLRGTVQDVTERRSAEAALRAAERRFQDLVYSTDGIVWEADAITFNFVAISANAERMLGYPVSDWLEPGFWASHIAPEDRDRAVEYCVACTGRLQDHDFEYRFIARDGSVVWLRDIVKVVTEDGHPRWLRGLMLDITAAKAAEASKAQLEIQLQHAHKMESVGRLAGGVAHDFNNMLGVILGNTEFALQHVDATAPVHAELVEIQNAARRSAELTRQLLAFARKQTVAPEVLELNESVQGLLSMLQRLLGEDIQLVWEPGSNLWPITMDPSQLASVVTNLCVNARDAIADVGTIAITTSNCTVDEAFCTEHADARPGDFVRLTIRDTGHGMDAATLGQIFEPFFTTKGVGQGTGLGLASVYGSVRQNGGFVTVCSDVDAGATFDVYLPRQVGSMPAPRDVPSSNDDTVSDGMETILLVEDESAVLRLTVRALERQGYAVLAANGPSEALRLAGEHEGRIDLLLSDVVMPEMSGRELSKSLLARRPQLKRLFMSGHAADAMLQRGVLEEGVRFIEKPFAIAQLTARVREVLDSD